MKKEFIYFYKKNFLGEILCKKIISEIDRFNLFDDIVMSGRKRINKGSKNFKKFINKSLNSRLFFEKINNSKFYEKLEKKFNKKKNLCKWEKNIEYPQFSKTIYGAQKGKGITGVKSNIKKNIIYLDMDFSVSEKGYFRGPHRDRDSRVINFLIYLNDLSKQDGGILNFYDILKKKFQYPRFPKKSDVKIKKKFFSKNGDAIFFYSTPGSYHAVTKFLGKKIKKRYFIYGSYSLNKKVPWVNTIV